MAADGSQPIDDEGDHRMRNAENDPNNNNHNFLTTEPSFDGMNQIHTKKAKDLAVFNAVAMLTAFDSESTKQINLPSLDQTLVSLLCHNSLISQTLNSLNKSDLKDQQFALWWKEHKDKRFLPAVFHYLTIGWPESTTLIEKEPKDDEKNENNNNDNEEKVKEIKDNFWSGRISSNFTAAQAHFVDFLQTNDELTHTMKQKIKTEINELFKHKRSYIKTRWFLPTQHKVHKKLVTKQTNDIHEIRAGHLKVEKLMYFLVYRGHVTKFAQEETNKVLKGKIANMDDSAQKGIKAKIQRRIINHELHYIMQNKQSFYQQIQRQ